MKPLTVTKMKINLTWQLLVEVSKSPQDRSMLADQTPTAISGAEFQAWTWPIGSLCSHGCTTLQQDLWSELSGVKGASWEVLSVLCMQSRGTWDVHRQKRCLALPDAHSQTSPVHAQEWTALGGHLMSTLWTCNLCTLRCQVPYDHGGGSASGLITCDCTKYFMQYLFLARTEFGSAIWDVKLLTLQITFLSAIKIITKGKSLFHVAAEDPIFNDAWPYEPSVFFQTNWKLSFLFAVFMEAY